MGNGPTGTVTFLFTDIEGSTQQWQQDDRAMSTALAAHDATLRSAIERHGGVVFKHTGDGVCAAFTSAPSAVHAAADAQAELRLPVRMGLHTGEAESRDGDYFGPSLNRAARVMDAGNGGQILVSAATASLIRDHQLLDLGEHLLKGLDSPERIFQLGHGEFPPLRTPRHLAGNLPTDLSTFIGREHEIETLVERLTQHRLVTLIGVGGTGKTRLAVETGTAVSSSFPDGCWFVDLAAVNVEDAVPFAFANGLRMTPPPDRDVIEDLVTRLRHKRSLLLVDNCEHVLSATADAVERIILGCPSMAVLATSREPLMVRGEQLVPVPSLTPDEAERLFLERARAEAPDLVMDPEQRRAVAELCRRLDGLPLALELAASRVRAMTPVELVTKLEERFRLLVGGRRSRMERHQTMRGTLDWSYDLCGKTERFIFDRLSVFPAGFDLPAACAVAGDDDIDEFEVLDAVPLLVDRSLLQRATAEDGTTRFRMLETMRAYGREHLAAQGVSDLVRERHARYMARTIGALTVRMVGPDEVDVWRRLGEYRPDALVAVDWCVEHGEWDGALCVAWAGKRISEREVSETLLRIRQIAEMSNDVPEGLMDEIVRTAPTPASESHAAAAARGWRGLRSVTPIPSHRYSSPPYGDFNDGGLAADDAEELVASLERWSSAPTATWFFAQWWAIRALAHNGHVDLVGAPLRRFSEFVDTLHSPYASRSLAELRGVVARTRFDWPEAARWYAEADAMRIGPMGSWLDIIIAWHLLTARALDPAPFEVSGADLRDPWICYREEHLDVLKWHGSVSTAVALQRLGSPHLADRFVAFAVQADEGEIMEDLFQHLLDIAHLPTRRIDEPQDLDVLLAELFEFADALDR
jgi:predicted ATPase